MKRVVFCWEMGGNYGHIAGFVPIYRRLKKQGVQVFLIVRDTKFIHFLGDDAKDFCFQAPSPQFIPQQRELYSYADILAYIGYLDAPVLAHYVASWCELIEHIRPDTIIVDHAPTALLAARVLNIPTASLDIGFTRPPNDETFSYYFAERSAPHGKIDQQILTVVNQVMNNFKAPLLNRSTEIVATNQPFLCSFEETDHYGPRTNTTYVGNLFSDDTGQHFDWPTTSEQNIFVYLTAKVKNLAGVVDAIANLPGHKLFHLPGVAEESLAHFRGRSDVTLHTKPVQLRYLMQNVNLVVGQSGPGLSAQCLIAGKRYVVIPTQAEQRMLARRLISQGLAYGIDHHKEPNYTQVLEKTLNCEILQKNCAAAKEKYRGFNKEEQVEYIVNSILN